jgi:thiol-disulfide isomerase/thioredoxin
MRKTNNYKSKNYKRNKKNRTYKKRQSKQTHIVIVGKIYADWCGYCQMMQDDWDNLKRDLGENKKIEFVDDIEQKNETGRVNDVNEKYLKKSPLKLSLQGGYPTIFKIKNGKISYFNGERRYDAMKRWFLE